MELQDTLGNEAWVRANEDSIKDMMPDTWTHMKNLSCLQLGFKLKLLGIDWRSEAEFGKIMVYLEKIGLLLRDGMAVKKNPHSIFKQ